MRLIGFLQDTVRNLLHEVRTGTQTRFDMPRFLLASTGLAAVLYGLSDASTDGWGSANGTDSHEC